MPWMTDDELRKLVAMLDGMTPFAEFAAEEQLKRVAPALAREALALREAAKRLADAVKDWSECEEPALVDTIIEDMTAAHAHLLTVLGESE